MSKVVLLTGMSGVGKTTLAKKTIEDFKANAIDLTSFYLLDGDIIRNNLYPNLGFSKEDRELNVRKATWLANFLASGSEEVLVVMSYIAPYPEMIEEMRETIKCEFLVVSLEAPLEVLKERDPKGLYKKALSGEIKNFTGITDPYNPPKSPDHVIDTSKCTIDEAYDQISQLICFSEVYGSE